MYGLIRYVRCPTTSEVCRSAICVALIVSCLTCLTWQATDQWENYNDCGLNSTVWLIRESGVPVGRSLIKMLLGKANHGGYSMQQMANACRWLLLFPTLSELPVEQLYAQRPPFVAHVALGRMDTGHFVVVVQRGIADDQQVLWALDGTTGLRTKYSRRGVESYFTGNIMSLNAVPALFSLSAIICLLVLHSRRLAVAFVTSAHGRRLLRSATVTPGTTRSATSVSLLALLAAPGFAGASYAEVTSTYGESSVAAPSGIDEVSDAIRMSKHKFLEYPGGLMATFSYEAIDDPYNDFAFCGQLKIINAWKWPRLYVRASGTLSSGSVIDREATYDFASHVTVAHDQSSGTRLPGRHMFSASFCVLFRNLQWAEGFQGFRLNEPFSGDTFPEVLATGRYRAEDDPSCPSHVLVTNGETDWAVFDRNRDFLLIERVKRERPSNSPVYRVIVREFDRLPNGTYIPRLIDSEEYFESSARRDLRGRLMQRFRLRLESFDAGNVDDSLFDLSLPNGLQMTDLVGNRHYVVGNDFDRPSPRWRALLFLLNIVVALAIVVALVYRAVRSTS